MWYDQKLLLQAGQEYVVLGQRVVVDSMYPRDGLEYWGNAFHCKPGAYHIQMFQRLLTRVQVYNMPDSRVITDCLVPYVESDDRLTRDKWFATYEKLLGKPYFKQLDYSKRGDAMERKNMSVVLALKELSGEVDFTIGTILYDTTAGTNVKVTKVASAHTKTGQSFSVTVGRAVHALNTDEQRDTFARRFKLVEQLPTSSLGTGATEQIAREQAGLLIVDLRKDLTRYVLEALEGIPADVERFVEDALSKDRKAKGKPLPGFEKKKWWRR